jgi:hypothetical protein
MIFDAGLLEKRKNNITLSPLLPLLITDSMINIMQEKIKEVLHEQVLDKECGMNHIDYVIILPPILTLSLPCLHIAKR